MGSPVRICVLISGGGTNLQALIDALAAKPSKINAEICLVISNKPENAERRANESGTEPYGLERAKRAGLPWHRLTKASLPEEFQARDSDSPQVRSQKMERSRVEYDKRLATIVLDAKPDLVVCLGYMRVLLPVFLDQLESRNVKIINLHPALPGEYDGMVTTPTKPGHPWCALCSQ